MTSSHLCALVLFGLSCVCGDPESVKSVTEGDSVSLNSDIKDIHTDDQILWMFGPQETCIAEIHRQNIYIYDNNTIFEKRLQMDSQTGSLTIRNIRSEHTGLYKLTVISNRGILYRRFSVSVYAPLPSPVITRNSSSSSSSSQNCSVLCSAVNVSGVTLSWWKGISLLSSISVSDLSISLSLPLEIQCVDDSYSCVLSYPFTNRTTHLDITDLCHTCQVMVGRSYIISIIAVVCVSLMLISAGVFYCHCRKYRHKKPEDQQSLSEYTEVIYRLQI